MIAIESLTDDDVCRRLVWEVGPGIEQQGELLSWTKTKIIIAIPQPGSRFMKPVEVEPHEVHWLGDWRKANDVTVNETSDPECA